MNRFLHFLLMGFLLLPGTVNPAAAILFSPPSWDLGTVEPDAVFYHEIRVTNQGDDEVRVQFISTCGCLGADPGELMIPSGETGTFTLSFESSDDRGEFEKIVIVRTSDPDLPKAFLFVSGTVLEPDSGPAQNPVKADDGPDSDVSVHEGNRNAGAETPSVLGFTYYYSPGCRDCRAFLDKEVPALAESLGITVIPELKDIQNPEEFEEMERRLRSLGVFFRAVPVIIAGGTVLQGEGEIRNGLEEALRTILLPENVNRVSTGESGKAAAQSSSATGGGPIGTIFLMPVILAGLLDGINPCAFTTLIFLLSALALAGKSRREILLIGMFFTVSVYITYFLVGVGFFGVLRVAESFSMVSKLIRWILAAVRAVFAVLSLLDYFRIRSGRSSELILQLPTAMKKRIHRSIRTYTRSGTLIVSSLILGFLVSVFELGCTGQIYFPTITYMIRSGESGRGFFFLAVYNLFFILPLAAVFYITYRGVSSEKITGFFRSNLGRVKLLTAALFSGLAVITVLF